MPGTCLVVLFFTIFEVWGKTRTIEKNSNIRRNFGEFRFRSDSLSYILYHFILNSLWFAPESWYFPGSFITLSSIIVHLVFCYAPLHRLPTFSLPCAIDVLTLGSYPRLPSCIRVSLHCLSVYHSQYILLKFIWADENSDWNTNTIKQHHGNQNQFV